MPAARRGRLSQGREKVMLRFSWKTQSVLVALLLVAGSGTLTAGVLDFWKSNKKESRRVVARGQEPNPAPPAPLDVGPDPAYATPAQPTPLSPAEAAPTQSWGSPSPSTDCAPQYSGFSGCNPGGHACTGCREPRSLCERCGWNMAKSSRRMHGDSYYCDCYPLFGPRYGYYDTCWRRLPEDCRCPIYLPPRKSQHVSEPIPTESSPEAETTPPPPQVLNFR